MSDLDKDLLEIKKAIVKAIEVKFHRIGGAVDAAARERAESQGIRDRGDFIDSIGYLVSTSAKTIILVVQSNTKHAPFVLGGKVPSGIKEKVDGEDPIKAWVERKNLSWVDKNDKPMTVDQMTYLVRRKIYEKGIPARNVFMEVFKEKESWILNELKTIWSF